MLWSWLPAVPLRGSREQPETDEWVHSDNEYDKLCLVSREVEETTNGKFQM